MQGKSHSEEVWLVFMTLQNSMDERKLKNYQAFNLTLLSSMSVCICVCVCVCVQGRPCVCV